MGASPSISRLRYGSTNFSENDVPFQALHVSALKRFRVRMTHVPRTEEPGAIPHQCVVVAVSRIPNDIARLNMPTGPTSGA